MKSFSKILPVLSVISAVLFVASFIGASSASWFWLYQPKTPKLLRN